LTIPRIGRALAKAVRDLDQKHLLAFAGGLAYYFFVSLFPLLIFLASVVSFLPIPGLLEQILALMGLFVPGDSMALVARVLSEIMASRDTTFLSIGLIGTLWSMSGGFAGLIDALNVAYDVPEGRNFLVVRLLAIGLAMVVGALILVVLAAMLVGPRLGDWIAYQLGLDPVVTVAWLYFRWVLAVGFATLAVELVYYLGPNVEQRKFLRTVPGALVAVALWLGASYLLGLYLQYFAGYSKTYGTLGAVVGLLLWFYISSAALLIGAEINAEMIRQARERLPVKEIPANGQTATPPISKAS
jgi:membrane protein